MKTTGLRLFIIFIILITCNSIAYSQPTEEQISAFNSIKKVRILNENLFLEGSLSLSFKIVPTYHFEETVNKMWSSLGIELVSDDAENYDATFRIQTKTISFINIQNESYNSCLLSSSISLEVPGIPTYTKHFKRWASISTVLVNKNFEYLSEFYLAPDVASIFIHGSFISKLLEMTGEIYSIDYLNTILKSTDKDETIVKVNAAYASGEIKDNRTVESLIIALKDEQKNVRSMAAWALGEIKDERSIEPLVLALNDDYKGIRKNAVQALVKINYDLPVAHLYNDISNNDDKYVQFLSKAVLRQMEDNQGIKELIEALNNKKSSIRKRAAESLVEINDSSAVQPLIAALMDKNKDVRAYAASALGKIGNTRAVEPLIVALKDKSTWVRQFVPDALGDLKDNRAVEPLIYTLKDKAWYVRENAIQALGELKDPRSVKPIILSMKENNNRFGTTASFQWSAIEALTKIGKPTIEPLIDALKDDDVRRDASITLGLLKDTSAVESLIAIINDDIYSRSRAITSLVLINDRRAVEPIIDLLKDKNEYVRSNSAEALGQFRDLRAVEPLIAVLNDEYIFVNAAVANSLKEITDEDFGENQQKWKEWLNQNKEDF